MNAENKNQEVNPAIRVSNKRGIQSQDLESQREPNQKWSIVAAVNKKQPGQNQGILKATHTRCKLMGTSGALTEF